MGRVTSNNFQPAKNMIEEIQTEKSRSSAPSGRLHPIVVLEGSIVDHDHDCDDTEPFCFTCQNMGTVNCFCGGDLCCCDNNGEMPCPKCDRGW